MTSDGVQQGSESAFPKQEYDGRVAGARALLAKAGIDVMVVTGPENIVHLHRMRALSDAIVVGAGTVAADDPRCSRFKSARISAAD